MTGAPTDIDLYKCLLVCTLMLAVKVKRPREFTGALVLPVIRQVACAVTPRQSKTLLQGVCGTIRPGDMGEQIPLESFLFLQVVVARFCETSPKHIFHFVANHDESGFPLIFLLPVSVTVASLA